MKEQIKVMISETEVDNRISEMAAAIDKSICRKDRSSDRNIKKEVYSSCVSWRRRLRFL